ncbi:MAG: response regulator, partial [Chloroflexi bacterium]|nr:response regulator [Chloroflexota bacterium]
MDDTFNQDELSEEDLAVLRAFDAMDMRDWQAGGPAAEISTLTSTGSLPHLDANIQPELPDTLSPDDMLTLFVGEVDEDLLTIQRTLRRLEPDDQLDIAHLQILQRTAHKIKGTAGAIGCTALATIAHHLEELVKLITSGTVVPFIGLNALVQTAHALELTLNSFVTYGQESSVPLTELEEEYKALNIDIQAAKQPPSQSRPSVAVELHRFEQLLLHTEQLTELGAPLENAQAEVEKALQELHAAQARLRHLETLLAPLFAAKRADQAGNDERPTSSLVARILDESVQRTGHGYLKNQPVPLKFDESLHWDVLEIDRFTEYDVFIHSFNEAVADVVTASSQLRIAFAQLSRLTQRYMHQAANVRDATLLLRRLPRSQGSVHGLLIRVGMHRVVIPFSHVQRIDDGKGRDKDLAELPPILNSLLGFPMDQTAPPTVRPVLVLQAGLAPPAVQVDEVLGEVKLVVKPLAPHLQRRGIVGTALDGIGNVLLLVDLPELLRHQEARQPEAGVPSVASGDSPPHAGQTQKSILIADDSVYIRQSLLQVLSRAGYRVTTARDGAEAFNLLLANPPHILLLDIEMPHLNGYDLLGIIRVHAELAGVKTVMLTSRSSEKHQARARELGAHAYLTKPCPQE